MKTTSKVRVSISISKARRILNVGTERTRRKLIVQLEEVFHIAVIGFKEVLFCAVF